PRVACVSFTASLARVSLPKNESRGEPLARGPHSAFCLGAPTCAFSRAASSEIAEGDLDPRFTAWTFRGDPPRGAVHADDRVLHDDLVRSRDDDLGRADLAAG